MFPKKKNGGNEILKNFFFAIFFALFMLQNAQSLYLCGFFV